jgi:hypothetical protein
MGILTDGQGRGERILRRTLDTIGFDPYDIVLRALVEVANAVESPPRSRFRIGSPCRFIRSVDFVVHVWLPHALVERYPAVAARLAATSPRWGHIIARDTHE